MHMHACMFSRAPWPSAPSVPHLPRPFPSQLTHLTSSFSPLLLQPTYTASFHPGAWLLPAQHLAFPWNVAPKTTPEVVSPGCVPSPALLKFTPSKSQLKVTIFNSR